jgi:hypothetical protein
MLWPACEPGKLKSYKTKGYTKVAAQSSANYSHWNRQIGTYFWPGWTILKRGEKEELMELWE